MGSSGSWPDRILTRLKVCAAQLLAYPAQVEEYSFFERVGDVCQMCVCVCVGVFRPQLVKSARCSKSVRGRCGAWSVDGDEGQRVVDEMWVDVCWDTGLEICRGEKQGRLHVALGDPQATGHYVHRLAKVRELLPPPSRLASTTASTTLAHARTNA
jgi:hypothetical protein